MRDPAPRVFDGLAGVICALLAGECGWRRSAISSLVVAPFYAAAMYLAMRHQRATNARIAEGLSAAQRRQVYRAATGGRIPRDPVVRAAAISVLEARRKDGVRHRALSIWVIALFAVLSVVLAFTEGGWFIFGAVVFAVALAWVTLDQRLLARRIALLRADEGRTDSSAR
jgi:hypothetical protein